MSSFPTVVFSNGPGGGFGGPGGGFRTGRSSGRPLLIPVLKKPPPGPPKPPPGPPKPPPGPPKPPPGPPKLAIKVISLGVISLVAALTIRLVYESYKRLLITLVAPCWSMVLSD